MIFVSLDHCCWIQCFYFPCWLFCHMNERSRILFYWYWPTFCCFETIEPIFLAQHLTLSIGSGTLLPAISPWVSSAHKNVSKWRRDFWILKSWVELSLPHYLPMAARGGVNSTQFFGPMNMKLGQGCSPVYNSHVNRLLCTFNPLVPGRTLK